MQCNEIKYTSRILLVIAAVAKVSCKHELWLVAHVNLTDTANNPCAFAVAICCVIFSDCVSRLFQRSNSRFVLFRTGNLSVRFRYPAGVLLRFCGLSHWGYYPVLFQSVSYRSLLSSVMRSPADIPSASSMRSDDSN